SDITSVDLTATYDVQVRAVNDAGAKSDWVQFLGYTPSGGSPNDPITVPGGFATTVIGTGAPLEPVYINWMVPSNKFYKQVVFQADDPSSGGTVATIVSSRHPPAKILAVSPSTLTVHPSVESTNGTWTALAPFTVSVP